MSQLLKQSTARNLTILMVQTSDHISGATGLASGLTIYLSKDGGAPAAITPTVTELSAAHMPGRYSLALTTGHTDTLGDFALTITGSGADPTDELHQVVIDLPGVAQTGDSFARLGAPAGASVSADVAALKADLDGGVLVSAAGADAILDRTNGVESGRTLRQAQRLQLAALAGKISGANTTTVTIRDTNDTKNRIIATVDVNGDRTALTYDTT